MSTMRIELRFDMAQQAGVAEAPPPLRPAVLLDPRGVRERVHFAMVSVLLNWLPILGRLLLPYLAPRAVLHAVATQGKNACRYRKTVVEALGSSDVVLALWAAQCLVRLKSDFKSAVPRAMELLTQSELTSFPTYERSFFRACLANYLSSHEEVLLYHLEHLATVSIEPVRMLAARNLSKPAVSTEIFRDLFPLLVKDESREVRFQAVCSLHQRLDEAPRFADLIAATLAQEQPQGTGLGFSRHLKRRFTRPATADATPGMHSMLLALLFNSREAALPHIEVMLEAVAPHSPRVFPGLRGTEYLIDSQQRQFREWLSSFLSAERPAPPCLLSALTGRIREGKESSIRQLSLLVLHAVGSISGFKHEDSQAALIEELRNEMYLFALSTDARGYEKIVEEMLAWLE